MPTTVHVIINNSVQFISRSASTNSLCALYILLIVKFIV